jgi:hypothetical protein
MNTRVIEYPVIHASGNTFMQLANTKSDVGHLLDRNPLIVALTETGESATIAAIRAVIRDRPYNVYNPDDGDIAFLLRHTASFVRCGGPLAIPGQPGPAAQGGHGPRHNSYITFNYLGEHITHNAVHLVTKNTDHNSGGKDRSNEQIKQIAELGAQMQRQAQGSSLVTGSGDLNAALPTDKAMQALFDKHHMTTTAHETGNMADTHGPHRIDYIWTMDADGRLSCHSMTVLKSGIFHSDHDPLEAIIRVKQNS